MKRISGILVLALAHWVPVFAQGVMEFGINFGGNPPPHTPGLAAPGGRLIDDSFYAAIYLDNTQPTSARILELDAGAFRTVFDFTNLVFAAYPPPVGTAAFSYEQTWQLTGVQVQSLVAGEWHADVSYGASSYRGQFVLIPEPSRLTLFGSGVIALATAARRRYRK